MIPLIVTNAGELMEAWPSRSRILSQGLMLTLNVGSSMSQAAGTVPNYFMFFGLGLNHATMLLSCNLKLGPELWRFCTVIQVPRVDFWFQNLVFHVVAAAKMKC